MYQHKLGRSRFHFPGVSVLVVIAERILLKHEGQFFLFPSLEENLLEIFELFYSTLNL